MNNGWNTIIWRQFGAAIDMLENAVRACPDELWRDRSRRPEYWYIVFHTLFWLDLYLSESAEGFTPPAPFTLDELDPAGLLPERVYSKDELLAYLEHCRRKCRLTLASLTDQSAARRFRGFEQNSAFWGDVPIGELLLYNLRHVQHHAAQLNLILRQSVDDAPRWVGRTKGALEG